MILLNENMILKLIHLQKEEDEEEGVFYILK